MTSFGQLHNMEPLPVKGQLRQAQAKTASEIWQEHRIGIIFVIVVFVVTAVVFALLIALKWREKRRQKMRHANQRQRCTNALIYNAKQPEAEVADSPTGVPSPDAECARDYRETGTTSSRSGVGHLKNLAKFLMSLVRSGTVRKAIVETDGETLIVVGS